ncbi:hypothetical protein H0H81_006586 [Sphagnurus paluster]|uniref:RED-like N-terminal domain-containing protein n=1 Tax=Sphagnurus paluster TaxID=117069 RepID=A0A9P7FR91_9AGAR|nr:hypothetical protein H0H81_006586 [Sphagnurus paluster]
MDQDSFRRLLQTPHAGGSSYTFRGSLLAAAGASKTKAKVIDATQPAFKPRKAKKNKEEKYRDRAAERRVGEGNDFAQVEAVLEDFEKRNHDAAKAVVESQRAYLGGDGAHSILVKGLDMALVEQNRAREAARANSDDDELEHVFLAGAQPQSTESKANNKKRTREDLIRELKAKRAQASGGDVHMEDVDKDKAKTQEQDALLLERAKQAGKFKPIGFKPIGTTVEPKKKKKTVKDSGDGERKKKKRKVAILDENLEKNSGECSKTTLEVDPPSSAPAPPPPPPKPSTPEPETIPEPEDFDIFADAGEYEGLQLDDDSDDEHAGSKTQEVHEEKAQQSAPTRWIDTGSPEPEPTKPELLASILKSTTDANLAEKGTSRHRNQDYEEEDGEVAPSMGRLVPLESSALPSIRDFLAAEEAATGGGKRKKRKGGGGAGKKGGEDGGAEGKKRAAEAKADRDYKKCVFSFQVAPVGADGL